MSYKKTKSGQELMEILRTGWYEVPGGPKVRDSTLIAVKTLSQLVQAEEQATESEHI